MAKEQNGRRLLRCLGTTLELDLDDRWTRGQQEQIAQRFGLEMDLWQGRWQRHVLETLFNYLTQLQFSSYYEKLLKFKWDCRVLQFPLFDDYGRIKKVNGRLYGLVHSRKDKEQCEWRLLTVPTVERELQVLGGVDRASNRLKQKLAEELRQLHEDQSKERSHYQVSYAEGGLRYIDTLGQAEFCLEPVAPFDWQAYVHVGDMRCPPRPSQQLKDCLYRLTGGNLEQLDQLSELFARVLAETMPSGVVWTLCGRQCQSYMQAGLSFRARLSLRRSKGFCGLHIPAGHGRAAGFQNRSRRPCGCSRCPHHNTRCAAFLRSDRRQPQQRTVPRCV